jgi:hypothetical protein
MKPEKRLCPRRERSLILPDSKITWTAALLHTKVLTESKINVNSRRILMVLFRHYQYDEINFGVYLVEQMIDLL